MNRMITIIKNRLKASDFLTNTDYICMGILTLAFALLGFFRLGNTYAPETSYTTTAENHDIVLDFGEYTDVSSLSIFLGNLDNRHLSLSAFNEVTGTWEIINGDVNVGSVFAWNHVDINYRLRYLGIVATDENAVFNEMAFQAPDGSIILPVNAQDYEMLFDEQEMFPEVKTYLSGTMFDEVYHGRTAYEFIHGLVTYETTHPHFGKILISLGIRLFGMTPFGWRLMSMIFGILLIPLMYLFAKRLFGNTLIAAATTFLLAFDNMHYTLSRIATIDIFAAFFILLMYYYLYRYFLKDSAYRQGKRAKKDVFPPQEVYLPLALCGISMALGVATKWTGIYAGLGLGILFVWYTLTHFPKGQVFRLFIFCCIFFVVIPLLAYTLCFIPVVGYSEFNGLIDKTIKNTQYMFNYHSTLQAKHYYSSPFYEWPVIWMPLLYANDMVNATDVSAVSCMGNPAIWWAGIPCTLYVIYRWLAKKDKKAGFLVIAYLAQYVPWMSISRITFIYHYFPAILFVILMMGYCMKHILEHFSWGRKGIVCYLTFVLLCFLLFFPVISGLPIYLEWGYHLRWLPDWILVL